jgi:hypothetical protein
MKCCSCCNFEKDPIGGQRRPCKGLPLCTFSATPCVGASALNPSPRDSSPGQRGGRRNLTEKAKLPSSSANVYRWEQNCYHGEFRAFADCIERIAGICQNVVTYVLFCLRDRFVHIAIYSDLKDAWPPIWEIPGE